MSLFVTLPHLEVRRANAFAAAGMLSLTPVMAATMMGEAFGHWFKRRVLGTLLIHHDAQLMAERHLEGPDKPTFYLQKFRGATLFSLQDVNSKLRPSGDKPGQPVNSDQPNAFMSGRWSLVLEVEDDDWEGPTAKELENEVTRFLQSGCRLAGGIIQSHGKPAAGTAMYGRSGPTSEWGVINRSIGNGFVVIDRTELMRQSGQGRVEGLLSVLATGKAASDQSAEDSESARKWFSPAVLGYALISPLSKREYVRENKTHAYCESMVGLVELISLRQLTDTQQDVASFLWSAKWPQSDVFLLSHATGA